MRLSDFQALVQRLVAEMPEEFTRGVSEIAVSPGTVPHPVRGDIYTMGECIPEIGSEAAGPGQVRSRVVLYHGSFRELARLDPDFDWRAEAWETLTHELRHHLEWQARTAELEAFDRAAEHNFARHDGQVFDPLFYLDGEEVAPGVFQVDDDFFLDRVVRQLPARVEFIWHGRRYRVPVPAGLGAPCFLVVEGVSQPPQGELVVVLRRKAGLVDLVRSSPVGEATTQAVEATD